jgi:Tat protein translocase TatC
MVKLTPPMEDIPMSLGDHLHELRRRIVIPVVAIGVLFLVAFAYQNDLKSLIVKPLEWAYHIDPVLAEKFGLTLPIKLFVKDVTESPMVSMSVSFYAAIFVAFPILVYQLWMFVGVGLMPKERRLAFLFIPAGIMFFYAGTVIGFFYGLPYLYYFLIKWAAADPIAKDGIQLATYFSNFILMTIIFGLIADIPWLIMVIVRVGLVTIKQLSNHRKIAFMVIAIIAAIVAPPDGWSMILFMIPLYGLFELGLILSRVMMWHHGRMEAKEAIIEAAKATAAERATRELAPIAETPATTSDDVPVPREQSSATVSSDTTESDPYAHDIQSNEDHVDHSIRDPAALTDADHYSDPHVEPPVQKPSAPRGMDEAGMFTEESSSSSNGDDSDHPHADYPRD